jgi:hypothetical protein
MAKAIKPQIMGQPKNSNKITMTMAVWPALRDAWRRPRNARMAATMAAQSVPLAGALSQDGATGTEAGAFLISMGLGLSGEEWATSFNM